jgi:hypothetical protein
MKKGRFLIAASLLFASLAVVAGSAATKTVEAVHTERTQLAGKQVTVSGKVVKVNNGIMKRNFLHIQDGSGAKGTDDLTVTSAQTAKVGDSVTVTGTVVLDTDFGMGYAYPLMVEKSTIAVNK